MNIKEYAKREALRQAGYPILSTELDEENFQEHIIDPSLWDYYTVAPFEWRYEFEARREGQTTVTVPDLASVYDATAGKNWPKRNPNLEAEFIGLVGFDYNISEPSYYGSGNAAIDQSDLAESALLATVNNQTLARADYVYDPIAKSFNVYSPTNCKIGMIFGYRLNICDYIKPYHAQEFAMIVTKKFLEMVISARSSIVISSEVTVDVSALTETLTRINENYDRKLGSVATPVLCYA